MDTITNKELDAFEPEVKKGYQANYKVTDKIVNPRHMLFGKKGDSWYVKGDGDFWRFTPKGSDEEYRVKWYSLESNTEEGSYGAALYRGINPVINGKTGELFYIRKEFREDEELGEKYLVENTWEFLFEGERYRIANLDNIELIED